MIQKFNRATLLRPKGGRVMDAKFVHIDLPAYKKIIKSESAWAESERNAITVFKTNGLRIVLIALHEGAEMPGHTTNGMLSLQVLEGKLHFKTDTQSAELTNGQMVALHKGIRHSVKAMEDTLFLLTLTTSLYDLS